MGEVYRVRDTRLDRIDALKILPPEVATDPDRLRRFIREAKAASALNHPNIATIYEIGESDGVHWIAMELVEGQTLAEKLKKSLLEADEMLDIGIQATEALEEAHNKGITHRDIKPANLMLTPKGQVKVLDFGLAKITRVEGQGAASLASTDSHTFPGLVMGTARYMSPEQVLGQPVDHRTDIFSLGVVLYEMATGQSPFAGETASAIFDAILHQAPAWPTRAQARVPEELRRIINKAMEKFREMRYARAADLAADLKQLKRDMHRESMAAREAVAEIPSQPVEAIQTKRTSWKWALVGLLGLFVVSAVILWFWKPRSPVTPEAPLMAIPLTSYPGNEEGASFSPDGSQVAFAWNGEKEDNWDIYVKLIGSETRQRLTTNPAADQWPAWSPDGRWIAFLRDLSGGRFAVVLVPPMPGPERILTEGYLTLPNVEGPYLSWSPDSRWLAIASCAKPDPKGAVVLWLISLESNEKRKITFPPEGCEDSCPAFSPDGHTLAFFRWPAYGGKSDLYLLDLSSDLKPKGDPKCIAVGKGICASPTWTADGRSLVFSTWPGLWRVDISGSSPPQQLASTGANAFSPALSRRGNRLAYAQGISDWNIWRMEITSPKSNASPPSKLISSTRSENAPQISPDGKKIAFISDRSGSREVWVCDADGASAVQLTFFGGVGISWLPRWSPDGSRLTFSAAPEGHDDVYVVNANGGSPQPLTSYSRGSNNPSWSRDGKWILFDSVDPGKLGIYKVPGEGGAPVLVTKGGWAPVESPDGRYIYYYKSERERMSLWKVPSAGGDEQQVLDSFDFTNVELVGDAIYFIRAGILQLLNTTTGKTERIASFSKPIEGFSISPDRRWIVYGQLDQSGSDLMLVENFR
jgi:Tol biopolymer transport system component